MCHRKKTMYKFKRSRPRITLIESDQPLTLMFINAKISYNNRILVAIKATNKSLQAAKTVLTPSLFKIIKQRTKENS
jgi:hypothetical protein